MVQADERIEIEVTGQRRRELVARLCLALNEVLSPTNHWESGREIRHWQATAAHFNELPATLIGTVLDEWSDAEKQLQEIEFSGYLDTADGHRAWGFLAFGDSEGRAAGPPKLERVELLEGKGTYRLTATLLPASCREGASP